MIKIGIDVGSTTVKLVAIDENDKFEFENDILKKVIKAYLEQNEEIIFKFPSFFFIARK